MHVKTVSWQKKAVFQGTGLPVFGSGWVGCWRRRHIQTQVNDHKNKIVRPCFGYKGKLRGNVCYELTTHFTTRTVFTCSLF